MDFGGAHWNTIKESYLDGVEGKTAGGICQKSFEVLDDSLMSTFQLILPRVKNLTDSRKLTGSCIFTIVIEIEAKKWYPLSITVLKMLSRSTISKKQ